MLKVSANSDLDGKIETGQKSPVRCTPLWTEAAALLALFPMHGLPSGTSAQPHGPDGVHVCVLFMAVCYRKDRFV